MWGKVGIICILWIYIFCCLFWLIFFSYLLRECAVLQIAIFCISYWMRLPGIYFYLFLSWPNPQLSLLLALWCFTILLFWEFFYIIVSWWFLAGLSDSQSPYVSRTLLSILANFNNAVVCMVSTYPLISKSSCTCTNPLVIILGTPITIGISVTLFQFSS